MKLLLMRHGEAVDEAPGMNDGERWLTAKGRRLTRDVAAHVAKHAPPATVWTSPLVRAVQTAEILVEAVGLEDDVTVVREIATGKVEALIEKLRAFRGDGPLCVVGHEPTLSTLAQTLLDEKRWGSFEKSGVCAIKLDRHGKSRFEWMLLPKKLHVVDDLEKLFE